MVINGGLKASHGYQAGGGTNSLGWVTWSKQYYYGAGNWKVRPTDYTIRLIQPGGETTIRSFEWVEIEYRLYARTGPTAGMYTRSLAIRKYWGQALDYVTIQSVPAATYSICTRPVQVRSNGRTIAFSPTSFAGLSYYVDATFDVYHH